MNRAVAFVLLLSIQTTERTSVPLGLDLYMPVPEENPITAEKIELGRQLFNDARLSRDGTISCASCHRPDHAFADGRTVALGVFGRQGRRNAPAIVNRGYGRAFLWDGRSPSLEDQVLRPIQDPSEMDLSLIEAAGRVGFDAATISHALASYVRSIVSGDSPYDRFVNGDRAALSVEARRGLAVFRGKANCTACHVGPTFSDEKLHNTGVAWRLSNGRSSAAADLGAGEGNFKTPTLREVGRTAPYMHDGSLATLEDVVDFYNEGGHPNPRLDSEIRPLDLSIEEEQALIAFLNSLSGSIRQGHR